MKITGPSDPNVKALIQWLNKQSRLQNAPIWSRVSDELAKPKRLKKKTAVNLDSLDIHAEGASTLLVLGKVLGEGQLKGKSLNVAAFSISSKARDKIIASGGTCMTLPELVKANPKGTGIKLIK
ncbi:MAG: 50S ribosomal protein L18e [Candidatus Hodarchaeales archaeon]